MLQADKEEMHKGWVRISENERCGITNGSYVRLSYGEKSVFTQVRGTRPGENGIVKMSEWYRDFLGLKYDPSRKVDLETTQSTVWKVFDRLRALLSHPDDVFRLSIGLAFISLALGLFGVGLAFLSINLSAINLSAACSAVLGFLTVLALVVAILGIILGILIIAKPAKPTNSS